MVVGCGALGNEVLKNLTLLNVGEIVIIDFDYIEDSNLCKSVLFSASGETRGKPKVEIAEEAIKKLNPEVKVKSINGDFCYDVGLGLVHEMDVVISCVDNRWTRYIINRQCMAAGVPWIEGGITETEGAIKVFEPGKNCYACLIGEKEEIEMRLRHSCPGVVKSNVNAGHAPTNILIASVIGALQVQEALKLVVNKKSGESIFETLSGKTLIFNSINNSFSIVSFTAYDEECCEHIPIEDVRDIKLARTDNVENVLKKMRKAFDGKDIKIFLDRSSFVSEIVDVVVNKSYPVMEPEYKVVDFIEKNEEISGIPLGHFRQTEWKDIDDTFLWRDLTLEQLGIPSYDWLPVMVDGEEFYIFVE